MESDIILRDYLPADAEAVEKVTLLAFQQFSDVYEQWPQLSRRISTMSSSTDNAEIIVAECSTEVCGAVGYIAPGEPKPDLIPREWAYIRLLVVNPEHRGQGIGRSLTEKCAQRALRDSAQHIALHTSPIMCTALAMYTRMGFKMVRAVPDIHGVSYSIYKLDLNQ